MQIKRKKGVRRVFVRVQFHASSGGAATTAPPSVNWVGLFCHGAGPHYGLLTVRSQPLALTRLLSRSGSSTASSMAAYGVVSVGIPSGEGVVLKKASPSTPAPHESLQSQPAGGYPLALQLPHSVWLRLPPQSAAVTSHFSLLMVHRIGCCCSRFPPEKKILKPPDFLRSRVL